MLRSSMANHLGLPLVLLMAAALAPALADPVYHVPDAELNDKEFGQIVGYGASSSSLVGRTDVAGPGVVFQMTLSGGDNGKIGIGDQWEISSNAGLDRDEGVEDGCWAHDNSSLAAYDRYEMWVSYVSGPEGSDINIGLILNTGLTGVSGYPSSDWTNDTFWGGAWTTLALGETKLLVLNFGAAEAWGISDNKEPHTGWDWDWDAPEYYEGGIYAINDRDRHEITNIGLQIEDRDGDALDGQIELHLNAIPEPLSMAFMGSAFVGVVAWRARSRRKRDA